MDQFFDFESLCLADYGNFFVTEEDLQKAIVQAAEFDSHIGTAAPIDPPLNSDYWEQEFAIEPDAGHPMMFDDWMEKIVTLRRDRAERFCWHVLPNHWRTVHAGRQGILGMIGHSKRHVFLKQTFTSAILDREVLCHKGKRAFALFVSGFAGSEDGIVTNTFVTIGMDPKGFQLTFHESVHRIPDQEKLKIGRHVIRILCRGDLLDRMAKLNAPGYIVEEQQSLLQEAKQALNKLVGKDLVIPEGSQAAKAFLGRWLADNGFSAEATEQILAENPTPDALIEKGEFQFSCKDRQITEVTANGLFTKHPGLISHIAAAHVLIPKTAASLAKDLRAKVPDGIEHILDIALRLNKPFERD